MPALSNLALLTGRVFMAAIFVYDATLIARFPADNHTFIESFGVPGFLLWPAALFQFVGGVLIVLGFVCRLTAVGFTVFCMLAALIFHRNLADVTEAIQFGKDFALAGGFLFLAAAGAGQWSLDAVLRTDRWPFRRA